MFRPQEISATDARKYFSQIINKVQHSSKSFVVKSYRKPLVRIVKEDYIAILEQVLGKKTVGQILEISGNDSLFEATKKQEIKKIFQRRLSGSPQQSKPQPQQKPATVAAESHSAHRRGVAARHASPVAPKQQTQPKFQNPTPQTSNLKPPTSSRNRGVLLLSNGKSYE